MNKEELRKKLREIISAQRKPEIEIIHESFEDNLEEYLQADVAKTPYGSCLVRHDYFPDGHRHGVSDIHSFLKYHPDLISKLMTNYSLTERMKNLNEDKIRYSGYFKTNPSDSVFLNIPLNKYLFLDIEATGLSGGVGVYPFLIGTGYFKSNDFHIYQLFMRDFHEERAVLHILSEIINNEGLKGLITYNGKCYDTTILKSRSITSGVELPISEMPNFDLLFPVRSIFKRRIGDCSLSSVEREVLNFYRVDDIPGYKVPEIYFDFVRRGFSEPMRKVFIHNLYDVLSMAAIAEKLCSLYSDPLESYAEPDDLFQVASLYERSGDFEKATRIYKYLSTQDCSLNFQANMALSFQHKREGEYEEASKIWERCIDIQPKSSIVPYIELAKFNEHHLKDYKKALEYSRNGRVLANIFGNQNYYPEDFEKRIRRLEKKLQKSKIDKNRVSAKG